MGLKITHSYQILKHSWKSREQFPYDCFTAVALICMNSNTNWAELKPIEVKMCRIHLQLDSIHRICTFCLFQIISCLIYTVVSTTRRMR